MAVVNVRIVRVRVNEPDMFVPVGVRLPGRILRTVHVLVVLIMDVPVLVCHGQVDVFMLVPLRQMEVETDGH
jgi:hypothetical protein